MPPKFHCFYFQDVLSSLNNVDFQLFLFQGMMIIRKYKSANTSHCMIIDITEKADK